MASPENAALDNFTRLEPDALARTVDAHRQFLIRAAGGQRALLGFHDLSECDFSRGNLSEADFSGAKLHRTRFREARWQMPVMLGAHLRMADRNGPDCTRP